MNCAEITNNLSLYGDRSLSDVEAAAISQHLDVCPLCRQMNSEYLRVRADLRLMTKPQISDRFRDDLKLSLRMEAEVRDYRNTVDIREWIQMKLMPYTVGVFASTIIGGAFLIMMLSGMLIREVPENERTNEIARVTDLALPPIDPSDRLALVSPVDVVNSRLAFANESPSINPHGGLVSLTRAMVTDRLRNEEVAVVAEVFSNGLAHIDQVIESPSDRRALDELERAFASDPSRSPFVPAVMENRPENMRIVLKFFQTVDVQSRTRKSGS